MNGIPPEMTAAPPHGYFNSFCIITRMEGFDKHILREMFHQSFLSQSLRSRKVLVPSEAARGPKAALNSALKADNPEKP
jgi:hypothetical protein